MEGFGFPDVSAPIELEAHLAAVPLSAKVKGMFLSNIADLVEERAGKRPGRKRYVAFSNYPMREMVELLAVAAELAYPGLPVREGMRRLGRSAYPTFASSTIGRVVMSMAGDDPRSALNMAPKAYRLIGNAGTAKVVDRGRNEAILQLRGVWSWPESYNVGVHEGALDALGVDGEVLVRVESQCDVDLLVRWRRRVG